MPSKKMVYIARLVERDATSTSKVKKIGTNPLTEMKPSAADIDPCYICAQKFPFINGLTSHMQTLHKA